MFAGIGRQAALQVVVTRGESVESIHAVCAAVVDAGGNVVGAFGDPDTLIYPRSALKPLQALALVSSDGFAALGLDDRHLAIACASHNGEPEHVRWILDWLDKMGLSECDLACGASFPIDADSVQTLRRAGQVESPVYHNCSGKHCGLLLLAQYLGASTEGYLDWVHPAQRMVRTALSQVLDCDMDTASWGIDGCGIPNYLLPIRTVARAFAGLAQPESLSAPYTAAAHRVVEAMLRNPYLVGGKARFDTAAMQVMPGELLVKSGAEGVCAAALPRWGVGVVTKVLDGSRRAADVAMGAVLAQLGVLDAAAQATLAVHIRPGVINAAGKTVGSVRVASGLSLGAHLP